MTKKCVCGFEASLNALRGHQAHCRQHREWLNTIASDKELLTRISQMNDQDFGREAERLGTSTKTLRRMIRGTWGNTATSKAQLASLTSISSRIGGAIAAGLGDYRCTCGEIFHDKKSFHNHLLVASRKEKGAHKSLGQVNAKENIPSLDASGEEILLALRDMLDAYKARGKEIVRLNERIAILEAELKRKNDLTTARYSAQIESEIIKQGKE